MGGVGPKLEAPGEYRCPAAASAWRVVVSVHIGTSARCLSQLVCESSDNESWWSARGSFGSTRWSHRIALRIKCRSCRWITHPPPPPPHPTPPRPIALARPPSPLEHSSRTKRQRKWAGVDWKSSDLSLPSTCCGVWSVPFGIYSTHAAWEARLAAPSMSGGWVLGPVRLSRLFIPISF